ncbi:hypothetical protein EV193_101107 [Herbihabitans rhizosphaerae]|uniref:DUF3558 domain-containing protein n=1 Tax=Herbihabitans rhizosphaerae TaxID=1872711 RepID=A0A4Q7L7A8_9PSEU|nr:hypothetical protein [Herbihabitans rhizosphaerae]RZS44232.1 hypothetical protein EV193_101107 [Herbihabitans rhizosphaerae]
MSFWGKIVAPCLAAAVLCGCSSTDAAPPEQSPMKGPDLCNALRGKEPEIEKILAGQRVEEYREGFNDPRGTWVSCDVDLAIDNGQSSAPRSSATFVVKDPFQDDLNRLLDSAFTKRYSEPPAVHPHEPVPGLGEGAAFGIDPESSSLVRGVKLAVVGKVRGKRKVVELTTNTKGVTLEHTRQLALLLLDR